MDHSPSPSPSPLHAESDSFATTYSTLLSLLGRPGSSESSISTYTLSSPSSSEDEITPASLPPIAIRRSFPADAPPLGPVALPALHPAVHLWLASHDIPADEIPTAGALCAAVGQPAPRTLRRRLRVFADTAAMLDLKPDDLPKQEDLTHARAWPRVLYALAKVAAMMDPDGWTAAAEQADLQMPLDGGWRNCVVDETWDGDRLVRGMAEAHGQEKCTVVVAGPQGGGKSATVARLLGRVGPRESHALACVRDGLEMGEVDREDRRKLRHLRSRCFPIVPIEVNVPYGSADVERTHVKLDGKTVSFVELPSMERSLEYEDGMGAEVIAHYGQFENVVEEVQGELADYVLLVERLDDLDEKRLRRMVERLQRLYGRRVLEKTVVVLTHGQELPPSDLLYEVWVFDRVRAVKEVLEKVSGERRPMQVPVVVFENSGNCTKDGSGRPVLPNGTDFLQRFLEEFLAVAKRNEASPPLMPIPTKRWWEDYVILGGVAFLVMHLF